MPMGILQLRNNRSRCFVTDITVSPANDRKPYSPAHAANFQECIAFLLPTWWKAPLTPILCVSERVQPQPGLYRFNEKSCGMPNNESKWTQHQFASLEVPGETSMKPRMILNFIVRQLGNPLPVPFRPSAKCSNRHQGPTAICLLALYRPAINEFRKSRAGGPQPNFTRYGFKSYNRLQNWKYQQLDLRSGIMDG